MDEARCEQCKMPVYSSSVNGLCPMCRLANLEANVSKLTPNHVNPSQPWTSDDASVGGLDCLIAQDKSGRCWNITVLKQDVAEARHERDVLAARLKSIHALLREHCER
jgi:hypothetical protein